MDLYADDELLSSSPTLFEVEAAFTLLKEKTIKELALADGEVRELAVSRVSRSWALTFQHGTTGTTMFCDAKQSLAAFREFLVGTVPGVPLAPVKGGVLESLVADDILDPDCPLCRMLHAKEAESLPGA